MNEDRLNDLIRMKEQSVAVAFPALMRKVYIWMALALTITGFTAYGVASSPGIVAALFSSRLPILVLCAAELILVFTVSARIQRLSLTTATLLFVLYAVINGLTLSSIFLVYTMSSIANVFFITAGTFTAMALVGLFTKTDLSRMGSLLYMAVIGLIIATLVNLFLHSSALDTIVSLVGVLVFVGLTAYDTQKFKYMLAMADDMSAEGQKLALLGALSLYLDFVNLFIYLLRFFGSSRD